MKITRSPYAVATAVSVATFLVYLPALHNDFVLWDDDMYVTANPAIRIFNAHFLKWAFLNVDAYNWHPLTWISHALDYMMWGLHSSGHHLTNVILHALNTFLVVIVAVRLVHEGREAGTGVYSAYAVVAGATTGMLFGVHPVHVESVVWVAERKDVLCGLFYLLSVTAYLSYLETIKPRPENRVRKRLFSKYYFASLAAFTLALMSKPMAVSLPIVLLILDWYPYRRFEPFGSIRSMLIEKLPFLLFAAAAAVLAIFAQKDALMTPLVQQVPWHDRVLVSVRACMLYLRNLVITDHLSPFYPYPSIKDITLASPDYGGAVLLLAVITVFAVVRTGRQRIMLAVWTCFLATLLPVSGIVQVGGQFMADRYAYLPSLGPFLVAGVGVAGMRDSLESAPFRGSVFRSLKTGMTIVTALLVILLSFLTIRQIAVWKNSITLWSAVIKQYPDSAPVAYNNRALAYRTEGRLDLALEDMNTVIRLAPGDAESFNNRGKILGEMGRYDEAIEDFTAAMALDTTHYAARLNRATAYRLTGRPDRALPDLTAAIALDSSRFEAYRLRAGLLLEEGRFETSLQDSSRAIMINPACVDAKLDHGIALAELNRISEAILDFDTAITLDPSDFRAYRGRGMALNRAGRLREAVEAFTHAVELQPDNAQGYVDRGDSYRELGDMTSARLDYARACELGDVTVCNRTGSRHQSGPTVK